MLAFSAVTQFPANGSSTRWGGGGVQAITSAEHVMTVEKRKIRIASPELGTTRTFLATLLRGFRPHLRSTWMSRQDEGCVPLPTLFFRRANPLLW